MATVTYAFCEEQVVRLCDGIPEEVVCEVLDQGVGEYITGQLNDMKMTEEEAKQYAASNY